MDKTIYDHTIQEQRWRELWKLHGVDSINLVTSQKPFYNLMMFPYPSAEGLHVGNMYAFTGSDFYGRFKRMQGYDVFQPIGLDGFGIHSENFAMKIGRHPFEHAAITEKNYYKQLESIGAMFDWSRTIETYKSDYYRWTQWLFITLFKAGLVYRSGAQVNWCNSCKTVLADEQVIDDQCERCGNKVIKKHLVQWFFKITAYADRLDAHIQHLDWSQKVKNAQKQWIGKKDGAEINYTIVDSTGRNIGTLICFTTRPETNFGATFIALSPEHEFVTQLMRLLGKSEVDAISSYVESTKEISVETGEAQNKNKTGVFTGVYGLNPFTNEKMPLFISNYVLQNVGTGAVVGVPAHDARDFEFAQAMNIPIVKVIQSESRKIDTIESVEDVYEEDGVMIHSGFLDGFPSQEAKERMIQYIEQQSLGKRKSIYHLRDWIISRQRFWGPPIPLIYCDYCAKQGENWYTKYSSTKDQSIRSVFESDTMAGWYPVEENTLPVELPYIEDFRPLEDGTPPLQKHNEFYETVCPGCGRQAVRSTEVSDTFLDSSWYFLRYPSVDAQISEDKMPFNQELTKKWLPVSMYSGGAEHSVLHLLYARFITMALYDLGYIPIEEPFSRFFAHGLVIKDGAKMSKSKGNVVNPDEYIKVYGADALRLYLMFMGPYSDGGDFRDTAMEGMYKWVGRVTRMVQRVIEKNYTESNIEIKKKLHRLIQKTEEGMERRHYNTAIAKMMEFTNFVSESNSTISIDDVRIFLKLLAPMAPFISEHLYQKTFKRNDITTAQDSIHLQTWPIAEQKFLSDETISIIVQVNGKLRGTFTISADQAGEESILKNTAQNMPNISQYISNGYKKVIVVPKKLVNFVV